MAVLCSSEVETNCYQMKKDSIEERDAVTL